MRASGTRGVQYVHCVMHKCIMVKVGGKRKHIKYVKTRTFYEIMGKKKNCRNRGVKSIEIAKIKREFKLFGQWKKVDQKFWGMNIEIFWKR